MNIIINKQIFKMNISKKRLIELCSNSNFEEVHQTLEAEMNCSIPKATLRKTINTAGLKCKNARMTIDLVDDVTVDTIGGEGEELTPSHPASSNVNNY